MTDYAIEQDIDADPGGLARHCGSQEDTGGNQCGDSAS